MATFRAHQGWEALGDPTRYAIVQRLSERPRAVGELADELPRVGRITFRHLTQDLVERLAVIVRFLAVLEMYKQGLVDLIRLVD